jgi:nucleoside-diphosphate-sugar epimerase
MKLLVTGGSGFIGTNLIIRCLELGYKICNVDIEPPKINSHNAFYKKCNIEDYSTLESIFINFKPDFVVHLAARTDLDGISLEQYSANTIGVENVCKATISSASVKKIVFASSMLVCEAGHIPKHSLDFCPDTVYGESKVHSETIIRSFKGVLPDYCIIRPTSIWGPWFKVPYKTFFDIVLAGKFMHIGNKTATKTYGYI